MSTTDPPTLSPQAAAATGLRSPEPDAAAVASPPAARSTRLRAPRLRWLTEHPLRLTGLLVGVILLLGSYADPEQSQAIPIPNPIAPLTNILDPVKWIEKGFVGLLNFIFGDTIKDLAPSFMKALLAVPDFVGSGAFGDLRAFHDYIDWAGWGLLTLSFTAAALSYWSSSYTSSGAQQAATAFTRTVGAIGLLLSFPYLFQAATTAINYLTAGILQAPVVNGHMGDLINGTLGAGLVTGGGVTLILGVVAIVMAIILLLVKITISALLAVLYCLSPLAIGLWPIEQLSWLLRTLAQVMFVVLLFPVLWAVSFGVFATLSTPDLVGGALASSLLSPLVGVAALIVAFKLPFALLRMATGAGLMPSVNKGMGAVYHARGLAGMVGR